jgi:hypothetical protein
MFSTLKLFFSSSAGWILLALVFALGLGAYSWGHADGYASGHTKGFTDGRTSRNEEVDHLKDNVSGLTALVNTERKAVADKIKAVQKDAANQAVETVKDLNQQIRARDKIISDYRASVEPKIQQHCGLSIETVQAINALIENVNEEPNETPAALPAPLDSGDPANPVHSDTAGGATTTLTEDK